MDYVTIFSKNIVKRQPDLISANVVRLYFVYLTFQLYYKSEIAAFSFRKVDLKYIYPPTNVGGYIY